MRIFVVNSLNPKYSDKCFKGVICNDNLLKQCLYEKDIVEVKDAMKKIKHTKYLDLMLSGCVGYLKTYNGRLKEYPKIECSIIDKLESSKKRKTKFLDIFAVEDLKTLPNIKKEWRENINKIYLNTVGADSDGKIKNKLNILTRIEDICTYEKVLELTKRDV